jgi:hypothetical protein
MFLLKFDHPPTEYELNLLGTLELELINVKLLSPEVSDTWIVYVKGNDIQEKLKTIYFGGALGPETHIFYNASGYNRIMIGIAEYLRFPAFETDILYYSYLRDVIMILELTSLSITGNNIEQSYGELILTISLIN